MTKRARSILLIVTIFVLIVYLGGFKSCVRHIEHTKRQQELSEMHSYEIYSSYIAVRDAHYVYVMCNPQYTLSEVIEQKFTEQYFEALKLTLDDLGNPNIPTEVYLMIPSDELPYGWEKDELNISMNFDRSVFHRHTQYIITIPYGADSLDDCSVRDH